MVDDLDVRLVPVLGRFLRIGLQIVDAAQVVEVVEPQTDVVAAEEAHLEDGGGSDLDPGIGGRQVGADDFAIATEWLTSNS